MSQESYNIILSYCIRLINIKPRTVFEIGKKIEEYVKRRKLDIKNLANIKQEVIGSLVEMELLDDKKYAMNFVELAIANNPSGPILLKKRLRGRGVKERYIDEAIANLVGDDVLYDMAKKLAGKKARIVGINLQNLDQKNKAKIGRYLESRGIPTNLIWQIIGEASGE